MQLGIISGILMFLAQATYFRDIIRKRVLPSVLSWFGWALLMGMGFLSVVLSEGWEWSHFGILVASLGCVIIGSTALFKNQYSLEKSDWIFLFIGLICVVLYMLTENALLTTVYAIIADFILAIPTIIKAYKDGSTEKSMAWYLGLMTWLISLVICVNQDFIYALFPIYLVLFSGMMIYFQSRKAS